MSDKGRGLRGGQIRVAFARLAFLTASCGSTGQPANADETTNAPQTPDSSAEAAGPVALVMGGLSTSRITFDNGGLLFSGNISLENNGGFASARSPQNSDIGRRATGARSLRVHATGDGKTYVLKVGIEGQPWSYIQRFPTEAAVQRTYELPVGGFRPIGMRLNPAPDAPQTLDPSGINQLSVYILDKQQGHFEITVSAIDATS